ncbi:glycoside hydrolase family 18 protein [Legionella cardiaca]|uniref:chitinase n=1 Tax=Legionella cardiaca TaxID=1071983 RepID=A0ABY8ARR0_9GAMM|nr:glycoside hydrolase family 18 protein [Legionella cardiaca]WED42451.1 glycoside hydrolase family 18 protein [Legionella cardiaca]
MKKILHFFIMTALFSAAGLAKANWKPYCAAERKNQQMIIAYLGADSNWDLRNTDLVKLEEQLSKITVVNYAFARFGKDAQGNTFFNLSQQDVENIRLLRQLKPDLPVIIAIGGWGDRESFKSFLENEDQMKIFVASVKKNLKQYQLDGIDIDWENELLASQEEIKGVATLLKRLHDSIHTDGYCISNAVPATKAYWYHYPDARLWQAYINWTTVMAYDHYGTFGPRTEHASALYETNRRKDASYPYPKTSGNKAIKHYYNQGLPAQKLILGIPFYCHSYFINNDVVNDNPEAPGLHVPVLDPNISSQMSYNEAYTRYGDKLFAYQSSFLGKDGQAVTFYGLIPIENTTISRFLSCEGPRTIVDKINYVEGNNPMTVNSQEIVKLGGVSFWSLQQDLSFSDTNSLLRAIYYGFAATKNK